MQHFIFLATFKHVGYYCVMRNSMVRLATISLFLINFILGANAQSKVDAIAAIKQGADSVWILSHQVTGVYERKENGQREERKLYSNGKLDSSLLKKTHLLSKADRVQLAGLLVRPNTQMKIEMAKCFIPHHAIVWKKGPTLCWIEVCFSCQTMEGSDNVKMNFPALDNPKWTKLRTFFKQKGMDYEL